MSASSVISSDVKPIALLANAWSVKKVTGMSTTSVLLVRTYIVLSAKMTSKVAKNVQLTMAFFHLLAFNVSKVIV